MASLAFLSLVCDDQGINPHYYVLLAATLSTTASDLPVTIRELWLGGAVLEGERLPRAGKDVLISRGSHEAFGAVTISHSGRCVVEFEDSIDEGELMLWLHAPGEKVLPMLQPRFDRAESRNFESDADGWNLIPSRGYHVRKGAFGD